MTEPAPRHVVLAARAVPLLVLPSAVWRAGLVVSGRVPVDAEGWYLLLLSGVSLALALLTLGLVQRWGERFPPRFVAATAATGAALLLVITAYAAVNAAFHVVDQGPVLIGPRTADRPRPGGDVALLYLPLVLWGPLLLAVTRDFRRRHGLGAASRGRGYSQPC
jgi:hypothetical protein